MKKILLLTLPLLLVSCITKPTSTENEPIPVVKEEIIQPETKPKPITKPIPGRPIVKKPEVTTNTKPDPKTDEMTKEIDSIFDELING